MSNQRPEEKWQVRWVRPGLPGFDRLPERLGLPEIGRLPWLNRPVRPPEVGNALRDAMLAGDNMLEDVNYQKVVPNRFMVEVSPANYARQFRPIEGQLVQQWRARLMEELITANSRQGRKEFRFGGPLRLEVRPAGDLKDNEARILSRVEQDMPPPPVVPAPASARPRVPAPRSPSRPAPPGNVMPHSQQAQPVQEPLQRPRPASQQPAGAQAIGAQAPAGAYLELVPGGQRWALYPGITTIGRSDANQIYLDLPEVQDRRLVSGQHAYVVMQNGQCTLYDGSPDGRPSANGTYVNLRRVPRGGYRLQNGDAIVLAAVDPLYPRSDTPGVVTFYYWSGRGNA